MIHLLTKCAMGMALLVSVAAAPYSGSDPAEPSESVIATSRTFSAAMLDNSKSRWAREGLISLVDPATEAVLSARLVQGGEPPPPAETAGGTTQCPVDHTKCPPELTTCPTITTHCPVHATVCKTTECPASTTFCPVNPTVCEATVCPVSSTFCPAVGTLCPAIPTVCPFGNTTCPTVPTQCPTGFTTCPVSETRCPKVPTVCEVTVCPFVDTECPYWAICVCGLTYAAGPPAGFAAPSTAGPGSDGRHVVRLEELGGVAPRVTFLPAIAY